MVGCAGSSNGSAQNSTESAAVRDAKVKAQESDKLTMLEEMYGLFKESVRNHAPSDVVLGFTNANTFGKFLITACSTCSFTGATS